MEPTIEAFIQDARAKLEELMSSPDACAEYLAAMGHMDAALRALRQRDERIQGEAERARIEQEARDNGTYDTFAEDPRDEVLES